MPVLKTLLIVFLKYLVYPFYIFYCIFTILSFGLANEVGDYIFVSFENALSLLMLILYIVFVPPHIPKKLLVILLIFDGFILFMSAQGFVSNSLVNIEGGTNEDAAAVVGWMLLTQAIKVGLIFYGLGKIVRKNQVDAEEN